jgi:hypothetical protein
MKVKIDSSSSTPRIDGDYGTLEYSEQSNKLFIKSRRRGVIQIGSDSTVSVETDPVFTAWLSTPPNISSFTNDSGYLTSFSESDPVYTSSSWHTTTNNSSNWDTAFSWGNHATVGYLTSFTEADPTVPANVKSITSDQTDAMDNANAPGAGNPFATIADLGSSGLTLPQVQNIAMFF